MADIIEVKPKLNAVMARLRAFHRETHKLEECEAGEDYFTCVFCHKKFSASDQVLRCTVQVLDWDGSATMMPNFCNRQCHDQWIEALDFMMDELMQTEIGPWAVQREAAIMTFENILDGVRGALVRTAEGQALQEMFAMIRLPSISWEGVSLTERMQEELDEQRAWFQKTVGEVLSSIMQKGEG